MTLYEVIEQNGRTCPKKEVCSYFHKKMTYGQLLEYIDRTAGALQSMDIKAGDRVGISLPNSPELLMILYAVNKIGAVAVMLNPKSPSDELYRQLKMTETKFLFFSRVALTQIVEMTKQHETKIPLVCVPIMEGLPLIIRFALLKRFAGKITFSAFSKKYKGFCCTFNSFIKNTSESVTVRDDQADAVCIFSGGTNGTIKAVVHSSASFNNSAQSCLETEKPWPDKVTMMAVLPAFHIFGLTVAIHLPLTIGGSVELVPFFNLGIIIKIIKKECPAFFPGVPTIFKRLTESDRFIRLARANRLNFSNFRHGFVGGDNLDEDTRMKFNAIVRRSGRDGYISMGYGMSECCPISVNNRESHSHDSVGIPFDGMQIKILEENSDKEALQGEITIASTYLMNYGIDEEGNITRPLEDANGVKWLRTGDVGAYNGSVLEYKCRQRRIIKVSGNTVFASAIEKVILEGLDWVKEAYVVPVAHATRGYGAFAFIVADSVIDNDKLYEKIRAVCKNKMIPYAIPVGAAKINPKDIPYTAIGKVAWGILEERAAGLILK